MIFGTIHSFIGGREALGTGQAAARLELTDTVPSYWYEERPGRLTVGEALQGLSIRVGVGGCVVVGKVVGEHHPWLLVESDTTSVLGQDRGDKLPQGYYDQRNQQHAGSATVRGLL